MHDAPKLAQSPHNRFGFVTSAQGWAAHDAQAQIIELHRAPLGNQIMKQRPDALRGGARVADALDAVFGITPAETVERRCSPIAAYTGSFRAESRNPGNLGLACSMGIAGCCDCAQHDGGFSAAWRGDSARHYRSRRLDGQRCLQHGRCPSPWRRTAHELAHQRAFGFAKHSIVTYYQYL